MTAYFYRAARADGRVVTGTLQSMQATEAAAMLMDRGLHPLSIDIQTETEPRSAPAPRRDLAIVFRSVASLVNAGVPLDRALVASEAVAKGAMKQLLAEATTALREGEGLAGALDRTPGLIPPLAIGMIRAGERGGRLGRSLEEVANQLELEAELVRRVRQALAYPILLAAVGAVTILVITTVVVPKFADLLDDAGQQLPPATQLLLSTSQLMIRGWWALLVAVIGIVLLFNGWRRRPLGALRWHRMLLAMPVLGEIRSALASARSCRALAGMLEAGMPLLPALDALGPAVGDREIADRLGKARELVAQGISLTQSLDRSRVLTAPALQLLAVGESSGQLALMAERAGHLAAQHAERGIRTLVSMVEPALIVTFGALVAFVASALLQAVYGLRAM